MRVLVTGANGLVGGRLVHRLVRSGEHIIALGRGEVRVALPPQAQYVSVDFIDTLRLTEVLQEANPEVIVNCAAMTDVDGCERDPIGAWAANAQAVATLAQHSRSSGCHLVHVSTDYVFDGDRGPYSIDAVPNPRGVYAVSKHAGEQAVRALCEPQRWTIARTAVVYGWPSTGKNNFGSWIIDTLSKRKTLKLFADQWVSPSHADNVADMLSELAHRRLPGVWHTCGADVLSRVEFGHALCNVFGFDPGLIQPSRMSDVNLPSPRPAKSGLQVDRTHQALVAQPLTTEAALSRFLAEYKEQCL
jgi:dTDP-4-dehydrorhamnose reductase